MRILRLTQKIPISLSGAKVEHRDATSRSWSQIGGRTPRSKAHDGQVAAKDKWCSKHQRSYPKIASRCVKVNQTASLVRILRRKSSKTSRCLFFCFFCLCPQRSLWSHSAVQRPRIEMRIIPWAATVGIEIWMATVWAASIKVACGLLTAPLPSAFFFGGGGEGRAPLGALPQNTAAPLFLFQNRRAWQCTFFMFFHCFQVSKAHICIHLLNYTYLSLMCIHLLQSKSLCFLCWEGSKTSKNQKKQLDDGWPESEKGTDVDVKYIAERRRCEKISEERMNIWCRWRCDVRNK